MNINDLTNPYIKKMRLPETPPMEALAFPLVCGYHTYNNYKKASPDEKNNILKLNVFVLLGTSLGALGGYKTFSHLLKKTTQVNQIKKDVISSIGVPLGGILGGFVFSSISQKIFFNSKTNQNDKKTKTNHIPHERHKKQKKTSQREKMFNKLGVIVTTLTGTALGNLSFTKMMNSKSIEKAKLTKGAIMALNLASITVGSFLGLLLGDKIFHSEQTDLNKKTMKNMDFVLTEMTTNVSSFDATAEKSPKARVKKSLNEIVSGIIIPSAIVLPVSYYLKNILDDDNLFDKRFRFFKKISNNRDTQKMICEKSISIPLSIGTYFAGQYVGDIFDEKISKKVIEQEFWNDIEDKKQKAIADSIDGLQAHDNEKVQQALEDLAKFEKMQQNATKRKKSKNIFE